MDKQLEITVRPDGQMNIETKNIKGSSECTKVVNEILVGVGGDSNADITKTDDYWEDTQKVAVNANV